ncbi:tumor necrosis factor receptor superfamily member 11B [Biomphalaria glabrata]|uniref:RING-type domain-containing protein n=1 Tax=Biomphalaria glabrata TaxID=6526 RepID=A0A2C9JK56_BIOGL
MIPVQESSACEDLTISTTASPGKGVTCVDGKPSYNELGISLEKPKKLDMAIRGARLRTFARFPAGHPLTADDLSEAGFYYAGNEDCTRCFFCGGGLKNWDQTDNPTVEHARWFPKCGYIRQFKGQDFVDAVQALSTRYDKITYNMVTDFMGILAPAFQLNDRKDCDPAIKALIEMGYDARSVLQAAEELITENDSALSSDIILDRIQHHCCNKRQICQVGLPDNYKSNTEESIQDVKKNNKEMRQLATCKICLDNRIAAVFLPCSHFVSCLDCAMALRQCPVCRTTIKGTVRAFMS